ncbi:hypothetical protein [Desulfofundulus sp.]|uniref:hypothetical protein n=1 Tax=Desulfofundulus sp. TaxID=2282750 RepID=UPI003C731F8C
MINKLKGLSLLKELGLPAVRWSFMDEGTVLDEELLWTVRTVAESGTDVNLPRAVGVTAEEAREKYREFSRLPGIKAICYPYFVALMSGIIDIGSDQTIIEACERDLWNLVTYGRVDCRYIIHSREVSGLPGPFLSVYRCGRRAAVKMQGFLEQGYHLYLEWSLARDCDLNKRPVGEPYLVFYECRVLSA